jgi:hypothetical protein
MLNDDSNMGGSLFKKGIAIILPTRLVSIVGPRARYTFQEEGATMPPVEHPKLCRSTTVP